MNGAGSGDGAGVEGLSAPLDPHSLAMLRRAVLDLVTDEHRRTHPPVLHVGVPGGRVASLSLDAVEPTDPGLRADVVAALQVRAGGAAGLVWLTRTGDLGLQDVDARWLSAARAAFAESGTPLSFVVVNRHGWRDPRSGLGRTWVRLRPAR